MSGQNGSVNFIDANQAPSNPDQGTAQNPGQGQGGNPDTGMGAPNDDFMDDGDDSDVELSEMLKVFGVDENGEESVGDDDYAVNYDIPADSDLHPERQKAAMTRVGEELKSAIDQSTLPDELIPEDFNPQDPQQMRQVLGDMQKHAVARAIQLMLKPVTLAMKQQNDTLLDTMGKQIKESQGSYVAKSRLEALVPELTTKQGREILGPLNAKLQNDGKSVEERAKVLKVIAARMGIKAGGKKDTGTSDSGGRVVKTGASALDELF